MPEGIAVEDFVEVVGEGSASGRSDVLHAAVGAEAVAEDVTTAMRTADDSLRAMIGALRAGGVTDDDLRTSRMSLDQHHDHHGRPAGFRAWLGLDVTLRDVSTAGDRLGEMVSAGGPAARIGHVWLGFAAPDDVLRQARDAAWRSARDQAQQLADLAGRGLGAVRRVSDARAAAPPRPFGGWVEQAAGPVVEPGTTTLTVAVTVRWQLV